MKAPFSLLTAQCSMKLVFASDDKKRLLLGEKKQSVLRKASYALLGWGHYVTKQFYVEMFQVKPHLKIVIWRVNTEQADSV